jgi:hypothetical protein
MQLQFAHKDDLFSWIAPMMLNAPNAEHFWKQDGDMRIYWRKNPNPRIKKPQYVADFTIDVSVERADPLVNLSKNRLAWDMYVSNFVELNPNNGTDEDDVFTEIQATGRFLSERRIRRVMPDGSRVCVCTSHKSKFELPPHKASVEAWNFTNGVALIKHPSDPNKCIIRMLACSEFGGWVPGVFIDRLVPGGLLKVCSSLRTFVVKTIEEEKKAGKEEKKKGKN